MVNLMLQKTKKYRKPILIVQGKVEEITKAGTNMKYSDGLKGTRPFP